MIRRSLLPLVFLALCSFASAQMMSMGFAMPKLTVLMLPEVKKELKITKEQDKQIQQSMKDMQQAGPGGGPSMGAGGNMSDMFGGMDASLDKILSPEQMNRLTQLWLQHEGAVVLRRTDIKQLLEVTDEQASKIDELGQDLQNKILEKARKGIRSKGDMNKIREIQAAGGNEMLAVLTPDQQKKFADMQGAPFKFKG